MEHATPPTAPRPCPWPGCGESLMMDPYQSLVPIPGRASKAGVHANCARAWMKRHAAERVTHRLEDLADEIRRFDLGVKLTLDAADLVLTLALTNALGEHTIRVTVIPDRVGTWAYWRLAPRPSIHPVPPQPVPELPCMRPEDTAERLVDRLTLAIASAPPQASTG